MEIYNLISSGKQKTPPTTTSTARYHPWVFSRKVLPRTLSPQAQVWPGFNRTKCRFPPQFESQTPSENLFELSQVHIGPKPDPYICEFSHKRLKNKIGSFLSIHVWIQSLVSKLRLQNIQLSFPWHDFVFITMRSNMCPSWPSYGQL